MDEKNVEIFKEYNQNLVDLNLPKSSGKPGDTSNKGLVFYLSDLHIDSYINPIESPQRQINRMVDKIIN